MLSGRGRTPACTTTLQIIAVPPGSRPHQTPQPVAAALLALGVLTRVSIAPALLAILAALSSWNQVGTLGTAAALNATSHAVAIILAAALLLVHGAGPISLDAWLTRRRR